MLFFENTVCLNCGTPLGFDPARLEMVALEGATAVALHRCANVELAGCNWMVEQKRALCRSCELRWTRPNASDRRGLADFARTEAAKRRAIMQLLVRGPRAVTFDPSLKATPPPNAAGGDWRELLANWPPWCARPGRRRLEKMPPRRWAEAMRRSAGPFQAAAITNR